MDSLINTGRGKSTSNTGWSKKKSSSFPHQKKSASKINLFFLTLFVPKKIIFVCEHPVSVSWMREQ